MNKIDKEKEQAGTMVWPQLPPMHITKRHRLPPDQEKEMVKRVTKRYQEIKSNKASTSEDESIT